MQNAPTAGRKYQNIINATAPQGLFLAALLRLFYPNFRGNLNEVSYVFRARCSELFFLSPLIIFTCSLIFVPILKKVFVTNFVTCITNFVICVSKFVTSVTKFVIKIICADNKNFQGGRKNFQGERKKLLGATKTHKEDNLHGNSGADFHTYEKT